MVTDKRFGRVVILLVGLLAGRSGAVRADPIQVIDVLGNMPVSQFSSLIAPNGYHDWGNEPYIAVNPTNPSQIVVTGFAFSSSSTTRGASLWYTTTGGTTAGSWSMTFPLQAPGNGSAFQIPRDQNIAYDSTGTLHVAMLVGPNGGTNIYHGTIANPATPNSTVWTNGNARINNAGSAGNADQPWISVRGNSVSVAYDNFNSPNQTRVTASSNGGSTFTVDNPTSNNINVANNFGNRIAMDAKGNVYNIWAYVPNNAANGVQNVSYQFNRSRDGGNTWDFTGNSVQGGMTIASGKSTQGNNESFGGVNVLRGSITAIASDQAGAHVYTVYGLQDPSAGNQNRLFLAEFHPDPSNPASMLMRPNPVAFSPANEQAALPGVAVTADGTIFVLYETFANGMFQAHLDESRDLGFTFTDDVLYSWTAPFPSSDRELGDYLGLIAEGNTVFGVFPARGNVNGGGINDTGDIAPFFFSAVVAPEPASLLLFAGGGAIVFLLRRRR
jgi:hypothetical protein